MKQLLMFVCLCIVGMSYAQESDLLIESRAAQEKLNQAYMDPETSILLKEDIEVFTGLEFFPLDAKYIVEASFILTPEEEPFEMLTTTERKAFYRKYAILYFTIDNQDLELSVYQNLSLIETPGYEDYLFIPFNDLTNGFETYGGGRYLDLRIPESDRIRIDFNKTYNPYCVYNPKYSCPIPPVDNYLEIEIKAGVKNFFPQ